MARAYARKLTTAVDRLLKRKVIDLGALRAGREHAESLQESVASQQELAKLAPAHALYVYVQNQVSVLAEVLTSLPEMSRFAEIIGTAEDEYLPSGPPMSPLTKSYFTCWAFFDAALGIDRETIGTCILALGSRLAMNEDLLRLVELMQNSRMGLYVNEGPAAGGTRLRELVSDIELPCIVPAGYRGKKGEVWLVRLLPPPLADTQEHVAFTTPYVILQPDEAGWKQYLDRTLPKTQRKTPQSAYDFLMKYGLDDVNYWNEYVFEAYFNHRHDVVYLQGLPDVARSRPHSRVNW